MIGNRTSAAENAEEQQPEITPTIFITQKLKKNESIKLGGEFTEEPINERRGCMRVKN